MTTEKFHDTLSFVLNLDSTLELQSKLKSVDEALANIVQSPANPPFQTALATALESLTTAASVLRTGLTLANEAALDEIGGSEFFAQDIDGTVRDAVEKNAMTPAVAAKFVNNLVRRRASFLDTVSTTLSGMTSLGVEGGSLAPGMADLSFVIPRSLFDNEIGNFAKQIKFLGELMRDFSEAVTGHAQHAKLEGLSSSDPTVAILADAAVVAAIAKAVTAFLEVWEKIVKIRSIREELKELKLAKASALGELTEQITSSVEEVVVETTRATLAIYPGDGARRNELENAIRRDTKRLYGQIERGLTIQFRATSDPESQNSEALDSIDEMSRSIVFPDITDSPLLLTDGEILEGELAVTKTSKKTTVTKTTKVQSE